MRKILGLVVLGAVMALMMSGCATNLTTKAGYDEIVAGSSTNAQAKYTFDVPYNETTSKGIHCDTTGMVWALKALYGNDIRFAHTAGAYTVDVKEITRHLGSVFNGYASDSTAVAELTINGKTVELKGKFNYTFPAFSDPKLNARICPEPLADIARQIKAITDAQGR